VTDLFYNDSKHILVICDSFLLPVYPLRVWQPETEIAHPEMVFWIDLSHSEEQPVQYLHRRQGLDQVKTLKCVSGIVKTPAFRQMHAQPLILSLSLKFSKNNNG
jgi:hypothetical protein